MLLSMYTLKGPVVKRSLLLRVSRCRPRLRGCRLGEGVFVRSGLPSGLDKREAEVEGSMVRSMGTCSKLDKCMMFVRLELWMSLVTFS